MLAPTRPKVKLEMLLGSKELPIMMYDCTKDIVLPNQDTSTKLRLHHRIVFGTKINCKTKRAVFRTHHSHGRKQRSQDSPVWECLDEELMADTAYTGYHKPLRYI